MQNIINFFIKNKTFLLFFSLFMFSLFLTFQSHSYHKSKFINSANFLSGNLYSFTNKISVFFNLKSQNQILAEENLRLRKTLLSLEGLDEIKQNDSLTLNSNYNLLLAKITKNSYASSNNILLLNKGANDGVKEDFGVINALGVLGIVNNVSNHFSTALSVLNTTSKVSAQLKNSNHFGTLSWDAKSPEILQLVDIPKTANIIIGDTIITSGRSSIFPKGIPVGTVKRYDLDTADNMFILQVKLFNDMTNLEHVYIIKNTKISEINKLLQTND